MTAEGAAAPVRVAYRRSPAPDSRVRGLAGPCPGRRDRCRVHVRVAADVAAQPPMVMPVLASGTDKELGLCYVMPYARGKLSDDLHARVNEAAVAIIARSTPGSATSTGIYTELVTDPVQHRFGKSEAVVINKFCQRAPRTASSTARSGNFVSSLEESASSSTYMPPRARMRSAINARATGYRLVTSQ